MLAISDIGHRIAMVRDLNLVLAHVTFAGQWIIEDEVAQRTRAQILVIVAAVLVAAVVVVVVVMASEENHVCAASVENLAIDGVAVRHSQLEW